MLHFLAEQPLLLLAIFMLAGAWLGQVRIRGVQLGPAAVLFSAIIGTSLAVSQGVTFEIPEVVGTLGLVLFTYTIGVVSGPNFFASLKRGWPAMLTVVVSFTAVAGLAVLIGRALGLSMSVIAGTFAGALTNTPALAAATERAPDPAGPVIGYSISYLFGVVGMLLAATWALNNRGDEPPRAQPLVSRTIRVERTDSPTISKIEDQYGDRVTFSRLRHGHYASPTLLAEDDERIGFNDLVTVVGPRDIVEDVVGDLGHVSSHNITTERQDLDYRRVTISNPALAGRSLGEINLDGRYGAHISRVRRGDVDLVGSHAFVVQMGDRVRVIAPTARMSQVSGFLGDSDRGMSDINPGGFALGLGLGIALGVIPIPLPGGGEFELGAAAGTLITGLAFGRLGRIGPVVTSMSSGAAHSLSHFGMITFLAYAGTRAGSRFASAVTSDLGWKVAVLGFVLTSVAALSLLVAGRRLNHITGAQQAGMLAGAQTQPAVLAFANDRSDHDSRVGIGYALVYPAAMVSKILLAQVLVLLA